MSDTLGSSRDRLSATRRALLEQRLRGADAQPDVAGFTRDPSAPVPLTPLQAQIWALAQSHPDSPAYHMYRALRFRGRLDVPALKQATATVVARHEALRMRFGLRNGKIVQTAHAVPVVEWRVEKSGNGTGDAEAELKKPFDLASGPPIRFLLVEEAPEIHLFLIVVHHIVADEWSLDLCLNEINLAYKDAELQTERPLQYGDYVLRRAADINGKSQAATEFWRRALAGVDHAIRLPRDYPRPRRQSFRGDFIRKPLGRELTVRLAGIAAKHEVTPFVLFWTAFQVLLARLSGQRRFVTGVPSANRAAGRAETAIGLFVASLPLPCRIDWDASFADCLRASRKTCLDAMMNQEYCFDDLLSAIGCDRQPGLNPVFQTMFVLETDSLAALDWPGLRAEAVELNGGCSKFDLTMFVDASRDTPSVAIEFDTMLFTKATAEQVLDAYGRVLEEIDSNPELRIRAIDIVPAKLRRKLLDEFGTAARTRMPHDSQASSLPEQIAKVAAASPDAVAVMQGEQRLSYRELLGAARELAHRLREAGVRPADHVGVFIERSADQIIAILGVQFAGAAYVPLDPAYGFERLNIVCDDLARSSVGGQPAVVTSAALADSLPDGVAAIGIRDGAPTRERQGAVPAIAPASPAYVIYTSGSTGRPKGVIVSHANLAASTAARNEYYGDYGRPQRFLLVPSIAFDSSVAGIFWTLCRGGTLVVPSQSDSRDPVALGDIIAASGVTHTLLLPSLWQWVLRHHSADKLRTLEAVIVAGEACSRTLVDLHDAVLPDTQLFNEYGPTEATVWASVHRARGDAANSAPVPIGRPVSGVRAYVLDEFMNLAPIGVIGELYVGGATVADGYLERPAETAARFVPDPFVEGGVMFRTGDRVRWRQDAALEFLGRDDGQIKLRGYRIEPAEIEAQLCAHPDVAESGVTVVAKVAADASDELDVERTLELAGRLPSQLVEALLTRVENSEPRP